MRRTTTVRSAAVAAAVLGTLLAGCGSEDDDKVASDPGSSQTSESTTEQPATSDAPSEGALPEWAPQIITDADDKVTGLDFSSTPDPTDELLVATVTEGDGPPVESGQTITANYFGQLPDADGPFDESFSSSPFQAPVGVGSLIAGWDQGLVGIPVGSRVIMSIPPELGYGDAGAGPGIPGGSYLYFVVDILDAS